MSKLTLLTWGARMFVSQPLEGLRWQMHKPFLVPAARTMAGTGHTQCTSAVEGCMGKTVNYSLKTNQSKLQSL